jgi:hypothetical protein
LRAGEITQTAFDGCRGNRGSLSRIAQQNSRAAHLNLFPGYADTTLLGHFDFQFYGSAAGRTYSAQAALLF